MVDIAEMGASAKKKTLLTFWGPEPINHTVMDMRQYGDAMTWYNYNSDDKELFKHLVTFLEKNTKPEIAKLVRNHTDTYFSSTLGKTARLLNCNVQLPDIVISRFKSGILEGLIKWRKAKVQKQAEKNAVKYGKLNENNVRILNIIEEAIEAQDKKFSLQKLLETEGVPQEFGTKVAEHYKTELKNLQRVAEEDISSHVGYVDKMIGEALIFSGAKVVVTTEGKVEKVKKARKPRAKKVIPPARKVAKVKIRQEYLPLKIKSIDPAQIIGKQTLWFYDIKYGKLTVLKAKDESGLDVKGSTVLNYDEKTSLCKRAGRKAESTLNLLMTGGKVTQRKLMDSINSGNTAVSGRLSDNIVLLKAEK